MDPNATLERIRELTSAMTPLQRRAFMRRHLAVLERCRRGECKSA